MDVSVSTHRVGALTTATNPANDMMKQGRGEGEGGGEEGDHEYELVDVSPGVGRRTAKAGYVYNMLYYTQFVTHASYVVFIAIYSIICTEACYFVVHSTAHAIQ